MILVELKEHLKKTRTASLMALSSELHVEPGVIRELLNVWISKGKVRKCPQLPGCGTKCNKCNPLLTEFYQWLEKDAEVTTNVCPD